MTPECTEIVEDVETWWREDGDLVVQTLDGERRTFLLGEIIAGAN
ncbi:hypothetical protein HSR121_2042 [Halapricum desulfuricans]|uniref:Uncharacterized protein n=1 Tax=Halapricum desulfuricans TaxID=2841257 RepID=A0A897N106_9EURY|nr:hypothetical protein HSR121_2042 [Halapricum desulfuricans]